MLDTLGYKHAFRMCNTYCFFTAPVVARTRFNIKFTHPLLVFSNTKQCYLFRPLSVAICREYQYLSAYVALMYSLPTTNGKMPVCYYNFLQDK
jgi:uncharacterized membrane protein YfbV (UPF0208 family)